MNYLKYWKLQRSPFPLGQPEVPATSADSASTFFSEGTVQEAIARIHFLIQSQRSLGTIVGPPGVGMSRLLKQFCYSSSYSMKLPNQCRIHYVSIGGWSADRFYRWVSSTIGHRTESRDQYQTAIDSIAGSTAMSGRLVFVVDNCDSASDELCIALNELQNRSTRLTTLLALSSARPQNGFANEESPNISSKNRGALAKMLQQSQLRIDLPAWGLGQTADYFSMMLESAGGRSGIFEAQAITRIHELSNGLVKPMNQIADLCLVAAAARKFVRVPSDLIDQICEEVGLVSGSSHFPWVESSQFRAAVAST
jgi:general secretion pathway protein A